MARLVDIMAKNVQIVERLTEAHGNVVREVWRVPVDDEIKTLVTGSSSSTVMDEAVVIYNGALKRQRHGPPKRTSRRPTCAISRRTIGRIVRIRAGLG
jgi:hypothetical protein